MKFFSKKDELNNDPKLVVTLTKSGMMLRITFMVVALAVASVAFYSVFANILRTEPGWQTIETRNAKTAVGEEFTFNYELGTTDTAPSIEWSRLTKEYTNILDRNSKIFDTEKTEDIKGIYEINVNPNKEILIEKELYSALNSVAEIGSRYIYYGPIFEMYRGLINSADEVAAFDFNPVENENVAKYFEDCLGFIKDKSHIQIEFLGENRVILRVSEEYFKFARDNEIEYFLDFYYWKNAFVLDATADELIEKGYTAGVISSFEGFSRALGPGEYAVNTYRLDSGAVVPEGNQVYEGPRSVFAMHRFPVTQSQYRYFYMMEDKTMLTPFIDLDTGLGQISVNENDEGRVIFDPRCWEIPR